MHDRVQCPSELCNFGREQILVGPHSDILQGLGPQSGPIIWIGQAGTVDSVDETCMKRCSQNLSRILQISWRDLLKLSQSWVLFNNGGEAGDPRSVSFPMECSIQSE